MCGCIEWLGNPINLEVHHKDGNHYNNDLDNLQLLCPNCHSYTDSYCGKNIRQKVIVSDETFVEALHNNNTIRQALISLGLTGSGANYYRANELIIKHQISKYLNEHQEEKSPE